ncbi:hypothetical protein [Nocardia sp. NPDC024068]|uniref:hypothetical protein n=1 Tax=Nocardia sp. NPDC024068 TaxID=3157197 RepID=UPI0033F2FCF3
MVKPTPWGASGGDGAAPSGPGRTAVREATEPETGISTSRSADAQERARRRDERRELARTTLRGARDRAEGIRNAPRLRGKWGYVFTGLGGVVTFILMFQHWMVAHGPDGMAGATPFGQVDSTTRYLTVWSSQGPPPAADLTGSWAVTASSVIAVTLAAIAIHIVTDSKRFARIATGGAVLTAVLVLVNMLYLTSRQKALKNMTIRRWDLGGQIGSWVNWAFNDGTKPVAGLNQVDYVASGTITTAAIAAILIAVGAAVVAVASMPREAGKAVRMPWKISVSRETAANYQASTVDRTDDVPAGPPPEPTSAPVAESAPDSRPPTAPDADTTAPGGPATESPGT